MLLNGLTFRNTKATGRTNDIQKGNGRNQGSVISGLMYAGYDGLKDQSLEQIYAELERRMLLYKQDTTMGNSGKIIKCVMSTMTQSDVVM